MFSRTSFAMVVTAALAVAGCKGASKPESLQVGKDVGNIAADTATTRTASAAVNELVRVSDDCDAARALMPQATASVDEAAKHIRTVAGQTTLDALRSQIKKVQQGCGTN